MQQRPLAGASGSESWLGDPVHRAWLRADACRQLDFFRASLRGDGGFDVLSPDGTPLPRGPQELHTTTRLVHAYALAAAAGYPFGDDIIDAGMEFLWRSHRDAAHGGYVWSTDGREPADDRKLAYGHVFVLLAGASAKLSGHPQADRLIADVAEVIDRHFWDEAHGLLRDEFLRDWSPFSGYRGMNANMHGVEAMLAAYEATGESLHLARAERILDFFTACMAPAHDWRLPEHYTSQWQVDPDYRGDPMFRPAGTTPGHSLEFARLLLQHWDLGGRPPDDAPARARRLVERALQDGWRADGGIAYTLGADGAVSVADRYWWPVAEAIGAVATLLSVDPRDGDEAWYRRLWQFADEHLVDHRRGGWFPELGEDGRPAARQFHGKPDIYHSLQAVLISLTGAVSRLHAGLAEARPLRPEACDARTS